MIFQRTSTSAVYDFLTISPVTSTFNIVLSAHWHTKIQAKFKNANRVSKTLHKEYRYFPQQIYIYGSSFVAIAWKICELSSTFQSGRQSPKQTHKLTNGQTNVHAKVVNFGKPEAVITKI